MCFSRILLTYLSVAPMTVSLSSSKCTLALRDEHIEQRRTEHITDVNLSVSFLLSARRARVRSRLRRSLFIWHGGNVIIKVPSVVGLLRTSERANYRARTNAPPKSMANEIKTFLDEETTAGKVLSISSRYLLLLLVSSRHRQSYGTQGLETPPPSQGCRDTRALLYLYKLMMELVLLVLPVWLPGGSSNLKIIVGKNTIPSELFRY